MLAIPNNLPKKATQPSYIALISMAILSSPDQRMLLCDIYSWISTHFPSFMSEPGRSWRNSIRHNLSLNECFIKNGRSECGKGHYWSIHPANIEDFTHGDYRRRRARRLVKQCDVLSSQTDDSLTITDNDVMSTLNNDVITDSTCQQSEYVAMTTHHVPITDLIAMVGIDACLTKQQQHDRQQRAQMMEVYVEPEQFCVLDIIDLDFYDQL